MLPKISLFPSTVSPEYKIVQLNMMMLKLINNKWRNTSERCIK